MKSRKDQIRVVIYTPHHKIQGEIHLYENSRLSDILNTENISKDFLPITNAVLTDLRINRTHKAGFISLNKSHIEMVIEADTIEQTL